MKVCVVGLGYIGFPTACLIARAGHQVLGVDNNRHLVDGLDAGQLHIVNEKGLADLAASAMASGRLTFNITPEASDVFIIAVPTPFLLEQGAGYRSLREELVRPETDYRADLEYVASAARTIAPFVQPGNLVILESTVPPRTTEQVVLPILEQHAVDASSVLFAHAPERVLPGNIVHELVHNNRIVGGLTEEATQAALDFYRTFVEGQVVSTDATTAELVKLMENTYRDVNIALANEFALVCEHLGVDVWEAAQLANLHPRVNFLRPGPGVGGHCIAVDPYFVVEAAPQLTRLIQAARYVNRRMPLHVLELFEQLTDGIGVQKVAILGASYKANVGDERESPAIEVAQLLQDHGLKVAVHDPYVERYNQPLASVLDGADVLLLLTEHQQYGTVAPDWVSTKMRNHLLLDTRGVLDATQWRSAGFRVIQLGSGRINKAEVPT